MCWHGCCGAARRTLTAAAVAGSGAVIIDEVDLVLHPMTSELNFPLGVRSPLHLRPKRWLLPMHMLDLVFVTCDTMAAQPKDLGTPKWCEDIDARFTGVTGGSVHVRELMQIIAVGSDRKKASVPSAGATGGFYLVSKEFFTCEVSLGSGKKSMLNVMAEWTAKLLVMENVHQSIVGQDLRFDEIVLCVSCLGLRPSHFLCFISFHFLSVEHSGILSERRCGLNLASHGGIARVCRYLATPTSRLRSKPGLTEMLARFAKTNTHSEREFTHEQCQLMVLAHNWLHIYLPHCLSKIYRVSYGLMTEAVSTRINSCLCLLFPIFQHLVQFSSFIGALQ